MRRAVLLSSCTRQGCNILGTSTTSTRLSAPRASERWKEGRREGRHSFFLSHFSFLVPGSLSPSAFNELQEGHPRNPCGPQHRLDTGRREPYGAEAEPTSMQNPHSQRCAYALSDGIAMSGSIIMADQEQTGPTLLRAANHAVIGMIRSAQAFATLPQPRRWHSLPLLCI